jgi:tRNA U34 5-carboxymethylaminomethyl modifying GTPase MnmE/TrmE
MLINKDLNVFRPQVDEVVKELHQLTIAAGSDDLTKTVSDLRNRINEPFMFVIVGEVKAGKSSFINALLETDKEICKVSPAPMTDTIQQILYAENEDIVTVNPYLKKLYYPIEILKEIAIVDTPGTNTIVANHQQITEDFIPACDLVVFVFEAKNPYRQSAWDFFDFIHSDWRKKVIFVLQQKDLMNETDLNINQNGVSEYAQKKGMPNPQVFSVSAKLELEGNRYDSGFHQVREYIYRNITGGKAPMLKLQNNVATSLNITDRIASALAIRQEQYGIDTTFRNDIRQTLANQALKSNKQVDVLKENLLATYDKITAATEAELQEELSFGTLLKRSFSAIFSKSESAQTRLENLARQLEQDLKTKLREKLDDNVNDLSDSIQQMAKIIDLKIRNSTTVLRQDQEIFSDIADRRANIMRELQEAFNKFINNGENFKDDALFPSKSNHLTTNITMGSGVAIIGMVVMAVAQTSVIDITGGVFTALGLAFAGVTIGLQRGKIITAYRNEIAKGRTNLEEAVEEKLKTYVNHIKQRIDSNFAAFDVMLEEEALKLNDLKNKHLQINEKLTILSNTLKTKIEG